MKFIIYLSNVVALVFGCHQKNERCPSYKNTKIPLCYRCIGIFFGVIIGSASFFFFFYYILNFLLLIPLLIDGILQHKTKYLSNNKKRLITGLLFGFSLGSFYAFSVYLAFIFGTSIS